MSVALHSNVLPISSRVPFPSGRSFEVRRLRRNLQSLLLSHSHFQIVGRDRRVEVAVQAAGVNVEELVILKVATPNLGAMTIICVPSRLSQLPRVLSALLHIKREGKAEGRKMVIVPAAFVHRQPRLSSARAIEDASGFHVSRSNRLAVLEHLLERGQSTLMNCALAVDHPAPFACVLQMVAAGDLKMNLNKRLRPETRIEIARGDSK